MPLIPRARTLIKTTISRCPECLASIPAEVWSENEKVWMTKTCPTHGPLEVLLSRDSRFYHPARGASAGNPPDCGCGGNCSSSVADDSAAEDTARFEVLSSCVALIEIVDSCNLTCPTCYASSPLTENGAVDGVSFTEFKDRVAGVIERKGFIDILQLTGGEPTMHPQFFDLLEWAINEPEIGYLLINTNGVRIATDESFRERLGRIRRAHPRFEIYLQFDGPQIDGQMNLRGADLREIRCRAIDEAGAIGVPTTLGMTVTHETIGFLGEALRFGLERPHCRGITFQPMFTSGRLPAAESATLPLMANAARPLSVADIVLYLVEQSDGLLTAEDLTPLPCGDPNCHTIGYLLRQETGTIGLSRLVDLKSMQGFLNDRLDYRLEDLAQCGCDNDPLGRMIKQFEIRADQPFRIFIKPFMDAWTFDEDRIDRCCTHVIRPDGRLDSFCRYYLMGGAPGLGLK